MAISPKDLIEAPESELEQLRRKIDAHLKANAQGVLLCGVTNVPLGKSPNIAVVAAVIPEYEAAGWMVRLHRDDWEPPRYFLLLKTTGLL